MRFSCSWIGTRSELPLVAFIHLLVHFRFPTFANSFVNFVNLKTELFMISDQSKEFENTWDFVSNRVNDVQTAFQYKQAVWIVFLAFFYKYTYRSFYSLPKLFVPQLRYCSTFYPSEKIKCAIKNWTKLFSFFSVIFFLAKSTK